METKNKTNIKDQVKSLMDQAGKNILDNNENEAEKLLQEVVNLVKDNAADEDFYELYIGAQVILLRLWRNKPQIDKIHQCAEEVMTIFFKHELEFFKNEKIFEEIFEKNKNAILLDTANDNDDIRDRINTGKKITQEELQNLIAINVKIAFFLTKKKEYCTALGFFENFYAFINYYSDKFDQQA